MCINSATSFHQKSADWALNMVLSLMLMLLTNFNPLFKRSVPASISFNHDSTFAPNVMQIISGTK